MTNYKMAVKVLDETGQEYETADIHDYQMVVLLDDFEAVSVLVFNEDGRYIGTAGRRGLENGSPSKVFRKLLSKYFGYAEVWYSPNKETK